MKCGYRMLMPAYRSPYQPCPKCFTVGRWMLAGSREAFEKWVQEISKTLNIPIIRKKRKKMPWSKAR